MRTIQDVGTEILGNNPSKLYIFGGTEYGIKRKYISILSNYYNEVVNVATVKEVITMFSTKHFIPLQPKLYIVRYDEEFISSLNEGLAIKLKSLKIIGTLVCLYESDKHIAKLDKFLSDYVVRLDDVNLQFKIKYLHSDFPHLPDRLINLAAQYGDNYGDAQGICNCMQAVEPEKLFALSDVDIMKLFGKSDKASEDMIKEGIASRNFSYLVKLIDQLDELDFVLYTILSTMIELEKLLGNSYTESSLRKYVKRWTAEDIYNMFMNTYEALKKSRSTINCDMEYLVLYLFSLLKFQQIPAVETMEGPEWS